MNFEDIYQNVCIKSRPNIAILSGKASNRFQIESILLQFL